MTRILSSDILIADVITPLAGNRALAALVAKYSLKPGGKTAISLEQFDEFSKAVAGFPVTIAPGGSSANVLVTLKKILGGALEVDFLGIAARDMAGIMIREAFEEAGIALYPQALPSGGAPQAATSYVILLPGGQRTIATYPGNAREMLQPEMITPLLMGQADIVFLQGSLWAKMQPEYAARLLGLAVEMGKKIWLALPTYSMPGGTLTGTFRDIIDHADLVLGNEEELARIYTMPPAEALVQLQKALGDKVAFITQGDRGAALVSRGSIQPVPPPALPETIVNTLGAGDTAFAGFMAGYLKGLPHAESAAVAMQLAAEKLSYNQARLPEPRRVLRTYFPRWF